MAIRNELTKDELIVICDQLNISQEQRGNTKKKIILTLLHHLKTNSQQIDINSDETVNRIRLQLKQNKTRLKDNIQTIDALQKEITQIAKERNTDNAQNPSIDHNRRGYCLYFFITIAVCIFLTLAERVYTLERAIDRAHRNRRSQLSKYTSYLNMCSNQAILFDDLQMRDMVQERDHHLINLGVSLDRIELYGRPFTVDGADRFFRCDNCQITMWTVKKLIRLCEKKYHTDLYPRYNANQTLTEKMQKEYNQKFDECQKAKQYLQSESSLGTSITDIYDSAMCHNDS
eukprot:992342_1